MSRPKKNGVEQPLNLEGDKLPMEGENAQQNQENQGQQETAEQEQEIEIPIEVESWAKLPLASGDMMSYLILASNDIEARKGRMYLDTGIILKDGYRGLIVPTNDNAAHGLPTETDYRLEHSDVISMQAAKKVKLVIEINDETMMQEQTSFGSRSRNLVIPEGTPLAELMIFKL